MRRTCQYVDPALLICFYTKKGGETNSAYEAQVWKKQSIPVYAQLMNALGMVEELLVKKIHFNYRRNAIITTKKKDITRNYKLLNVRCDVPVVYYDELCFFRDNKEASIGLKEAWNYCIANSVDSNCKELIAEEREKGNVVSIIYDEGLCRSSTMVGKIPDVKEYDDRLHMVIATHKNQKYFLLQK